MPAGGPGDHPLTDILAWKLTVFGDEPDELVRQVVALGGQHDLESSFYNLVGNDPRYFPEADVETLTRRLRVLRDRLHAEAIERGWDVE